MKKYLVSFRDRHGKCTGDPPVFFYAKTDGEAIEYFRSKSYWKGIAFLYPFHEEHPDPQFHEHLIEVPE